MKRFFLFWIYWHSASAWEGLNTLSAQFKPGWQFKIGGYSFEQVELQEMDHFKGWSAQASIVWSTDSWRIRFDYPAYTRGEARLKEGGQKISIRGAGGVYDYLNLRLEKSWQANTAYYIGAGTVGKPLDTDKPNDKGGHDKLSHAGNRFEIGALWNLEQQRINLGLIYYDGSDDIYPGNADSFWAVDFKYGWFYTMPSIRPGIELQYFGDLNRLNHISLVPQLTGSIGALALKGGLIIGLGGNGNRLGGQIQAAWSF